MARAKLQAKQQAFPEPPETWVGSRPEWAIYHALLSLGKKEGVDFTYQSSQLGGRMEKGGAVIDFLFYDPPNLGVNIQSTYYHYREVSQRVKGAMQRAQLEAYGIKMIYIDEEDALKAPRYFVMEAMAGRDHSQMM